MINVKIHLPVLYLSLHTALFSSKNYVSELENIALEAIWANLYLTEFPDNGGSPLPSERYYFCPEDMNSL